MLNRLFRNRHSGVLLLIVLVSELLVRPWGEFPLNDDWSYAKSVKLNLELGIVDIGMWGAMTLATQIYWGVLWSKLFGFSFLVLRISSLVSSAIGLLVLYKLAVRLTNQKTIALAAAVSLYFVPIYFNLSNTFMTDVNFTTLCILFLYCSFELQRSAKLLWFVPLFLVSLALVFLRQFGIVAPLALLLSSFFYPNKKIVSILLSFLMLACLMLLLKLYEGYLRTHLPDISAYRFSGGLDFTSATFYNMLYERLSDRIYLVLNTILFFTLPFILGALPTALRTNSAIKIGLSAIVAIALTVWLVPRVELPTANILNNMSLGPETFYQNWMGAQYHSYNTVFPILMLVLRYLFLILGIWTLLLLPVGKKLHVGVYSSKAWNVLLAFFSLAYFATLLLSESFFDRYLLPLFAIALLFYLPYVQSLKFNKVVFFLALLPFVYCSIAGTHDYFRINEERWSAYNALKFAGVDRLKINAGFEVNCWQDGDRVWWSNFGELKHFNYLIQYRQEPEFAPVIRLPYHCWFPPKDDYLFIFARNQSSIHKDTIIQ